MTILAKCVWLREKGGSVEWHPKSIMINGRSGGNRTSRVGKRI